MPPPLTAQSTARGGFSYICKSFTNLQFPPFQSANAPLVCTLVVRPRRNESPLFAKPLFLLRVYLKTPNAPGQRAFLRCAASFFLEIRQYSCEKMSCATQKSLAAGHIMSFQTHPSLAMGGLGRSEPHVVHQQKRRAAERKAGHQHTKNAKFHPNGSSPRGHSETSCRRT